MNPRGDKKVIRTWSRASTIFPADGRAIPSRFMMAAGMCRFTSQRIWSGIAWVSLRPPVTSVGTSRKPLLLKNPAPGKGSKPWQPIFVLIDEYVGVSAQKVRLVCDMVRGKPAVEAWTRCNLRAQCRGHCTLANCSASAIANAEENFGVSRDDLVVYRIFADEAPTRKWRRFGARGRFKPILTARIAYHRDITGAGVRSEEIIWVVKFIR